MNVATITRHDLVIFNIYKQTSTTLIVCNIIALLCIFYSKKINKSGDNSCCCTVQRQYSLLYY